MAHGFPTGTVTFLFTDIEGSTRLLHELGADGYTAALGRHRRAVRGAFARHDGVEVDTQGDSFFIAFSTAPAAVAAASDAQEALADGPIRVRMGLHTGTPNVTDEGYVGPDVHRAARIAAAGHGGQILISSSTASLVDGGRLRDLGEHRLKDLAASERIYQLGDETFPPLKSLHQTNLPVPSTPFVGRRRALAEVTSLLVSHGARLVTLTGPAGTGKTRIALQSAAEASDAYPDGVFWAPLSPLRDPRLVLEAAAQALEAKGVLADRIADRRVLLVLDNFEHLMDAAPDLAGLLAACPNLQLLVTSRELLRVPGEQAYPVPPLDPEDATELFTARARAADPSFEPTPIIERLCSQLENLPLTLELAATRVAVLSPEQLLDRLSERLDLLKAVRGVDPRQQTLRATIEWSYDLLGEHERRLFERLSTFRGGAMLDAAEEICEADIDTFQSLIDKSLLRRQRERLWMLETLREYAAEQLELHGAAEIVADRHADYFIALGEDATRGAPDEDVERTRRLYSELDNFRRAREWLEALGDVQRELRLATRAFWCLWTHANLRELHRWLVSALERAADVSPALRGEALGAAALAAANLGDAEVAREHARESLALATERDDKRQIEWALRVLSFDEPDLEERRRLLDECERLSRELGNDVGLSWVAYLRGLTFMDEGRPEPARRMLEEAAALFHKLGRRWEATNAEISVGYTLLAADQHAEARPLLERALADAVALASTASTIEVLVLLAAEQMAAGDAVAATRLLGAVKAVAGQHGHELDPRLEGQVFEATDRSARERLGPAFEAELAAGSALTLEEAIELALHAESA